MVESHVTLNDYHNLTRWLAWVAESGYAVGCKPITRGFESPPMLQSSSKNSGSACSHVTRLTRRRQTMKLVMVNGGHSTRE